MAEQCCRGEFHHAGVTGSGLDLTRSGTEAAEGAFGGGRRSALRRHLAVIDGENGAFVIVDGPSILTDIAGVVNATREFAEVSAFDRFQRAYSNFCRFGDL